MPALLNWTGKSFTDRPVPDHHRRAADASCSTSSWASSWPDRVGRHVYAVGDDTEAARLAGIRVDRVLLSVYTVAGLIYGITAWILIGRAGAGQPERDRPTPTWTASPPS